MHKKVDYEKGTYEFGLNRKDSQESHEELDQLESENNGKDLERISKRVKKRRKNGGL